MKKLLIGIGVIIVLVTFYNMGKGKTTTTTTPTATGSATVNQNLQQFAVTVASQVRKASYGQFFKPKAGKEYLIVHVDIKNVSDREQESIGPSSFKVQSSDGAIVGNSFLNMEDELQYVELAPNGSISGSVGFEIPKGDKQLKLIFQPNMFIDSQRINIDL